MAAARARGGPALRRLTMLVLWTRTERPWQPTALALARERVPLAILARMPRYRRWQDLQMGLLGKLLLRAGLRTLGHDPDCLQAMTWSAIGRPALPWSGDFNLSHSGGVVACALSAELRVGLDVERVHAIGADDLARVLTDGERAAIAAAADPSAETCRIWTFKEAVVKADGRGVGIDLQRIDSRRAAVEVDGVTWHVRPLALPAPVACHLATDRAAAAPPLTEVAEAELLRA